MSLALSPEELFERLHHESRVLFEVVANLRLVAECFPTPTNTENQDPVLIVRRFARFAAAEARECLLRADRILLEGVARWGLPPGHPLFPAERSRPTDREDLRRKEAAVHALRSGLHRVLETAEETLYSAQPESLAVFASRVYAIAHCAHRDYALLRRGADDAVAALRVADDTLSGTGTIATEAPRCL